MERETCKMLSTMIRDAKTGERLIRLSKWVNPDDIIVSDEDTDSGPTVKVEVQSGRTTLRGTIDRDAWRQYLTRDEPPLVPEIPMPTDATEGSKVLSLFVGSTKPRPVNVTKPQAKAEPLFRRA